MSVIVEAFRDWPAYRMLVEHVSTGDPLSADPHDVHGNLCAADHDRLAALLYAHVFAASMDEGRELVSYLTGLTREGKRPRNPVEAGLVSREVVEDALAAAEALRDAADRLDAARDRFEVAPSPERHAELLAAEDAFVEARRLSAEPGGG